MEKRRCAGSNQTEKKLTISIEGDVDKNYTKNEQRNTEKLKGDLVLSVLSAVLYSDS